MQKDKNKRCIPRSCPLEKASKGIAMAFFLKVGKIVNVVVGSYKISPSKMALERRGDAKPVCDRRGVVGEKRRMEPKAV